jgi:hypothetical protein
VLCVLSAVLALTVGASCLWDVDLGELSLASTLRCCFRILFLHHAPVTRIWISPEALVFHFSTSTILHPRRVYGVFPRSVDRVVSQLQSRPPPAFNRSSFISSISNDYNKQIDIHTIVTDFAVVGGELKCSLSMI